MKLNKKNREREKKEQIHFLNKFFLMKNNILKKIDTINFNSLYDY
jgi:hypothetical protein